MNGYGINTYKWVNSSGEAFLVKYHFTSSQGVATMDVDTAVWKSGVEPDYYRQDLFNSIKDKNYPEWTFSV